MILYRLKTSTGEDEYEMWGYYETFTKQDYDEDKITDLTILSEFHDYNFAEHENEDQSDFWYGDKVVWVEDVMNVTEEELHTLHKFQVIYYKGGTNVT